MNNGRAFWATVKEKIMNNQFSAKLLLVAALFISVLVGPAISVRAQAVSPTPTTTTLPAPTVASTQAISTRQSPAASFDPNVVTFAQFRQSEIQLVGPYDSASFTFTLPPDWSITAGAQLSLSMGISFNTVTTLMQGQPYTVMGGGTLTVLMNNATLAVLPVNQVGDTKVNIPIPLTALNSTSSDGSMLIRFNLSSFASCTVDQNMQVNIHPASFFSLPHGLVQPSTNLVNFPRPIIQNSFLSDSALLILPDHPTASEQQAALTVAAALGKFSGGSIVLDMITASQFVPTNGTTNSLIFVGNASSLPILGQLHLPLPASGGKFQISGGDPSDGVIQMIASPWNNAFVALVVSGNTDQGTIKAAQAISTGVLRPNSSPNLAIVQQVQANLLSVPRAVDETLTDLGYGGNLFTTRGSSSAQYAFNIPSGMTVGTDAYFELNFGHSALLDYNRSGIVVKFNGEPIGSVRLSDATAAQPTNQAKIMIPPSLVVPGTNQIEVVANIVPIDDCSPHNLQGFWINIWPQSLLHLPLFSTSNNPASNQGLAAFPAPFVYNPLLNDTAFVLERNDLAGWNAAVHIAAYIGNQANGSLTGLSAFYGDDVPASERSKYNLLVIGQPSQMPLVAQMNNSLPAPFSVGGDVASENNLQVIYRIPASSPMGYIEEMPSPWNPSKVVLATLGNTTQGVQWATAALLDPNLNGLLAGNFAVVNGHQIITTDTHLASVTTGSNASAQAPIAVVATPPSANPELMAIARPDWILPVLALSVVLIVLILAIVVIGSWLRNRTDRNHREIKNIEKKDQLDLPKP